MKNTIWKSLAILWALSLAAMWLVAFITAEKENPVPFLVFAVSLFSTIIAGGIWQRNNEKRDWNGGVCAVNGLPWQSFDMDFQGGRGYKAGDQTIWISYSVDRP